MRIYKTQNYDLFKVHQTNRDINKYHVNILVKSIEKNNLLEYNPILVNEDMVVIDGQHRLEACKKLDIPVYYCFTYVEDITQSIISLNANAKTWGIKDYAEAYARSGNKNYQILLEFMRENKIGVYNAIYYLSHRNTDVKDFKNGKYIVGSVDKAQKCVDLDVRMSPYMENKKRKNTYMQRSIANFIYGGFDPDRLMKKMAQIKEPIPQYGSTKLTMRALEDIYNFKARKATRLF